MPAQISPNYHQNISAGYTNRSCIRHFPHDVRRELERRKLGIDAEPRLVSFPAVYVKIPREERALAKRMLDVGYRALARKFDPANGGDPEQMRRLFELAATVREQLEVVQ
jgi:hypothetical protein